MCRTTDFQGFYFNEQDRLRVKSFFVRFSSSSLKNLPEFLTLVYLPRINETGLEISGKRIRPDSPAFVTLHRVITAETEDGEVIYGSRERVVASEGVMFEVYLNEEKALKGIYRKDEEEEWKLECKCVLEREVMVARADVCVGLEGHVAMIERVEMVVKRKRNRRKASLEEIPEERMVEDVGDEFGSESDRCCCCSCGESESTSDEDLGFEEEEEEMNMEGVRWAVDLGIWVMCLGVGYFVSKASAKSLRRRRIL